MAKGVIVQSQVAAMNVDSYNRSATASYDVENGMVFYFNGKSATTGEAELWSAATPVTASLTNLWMAYEPEVVLTVSGTKQFKGIDVDPQDFYVPSGTPFSAFQPKIGDLILMTDDALAGTKSSNQYVVATNGAAKLTWAASAISGLTLKLVATQYISIGFSMPASQRVTAYQFEVVAVA
jgi:hypothetical protein